MLSASRLPGDPPRTGNSHLGNPLLPLPNALSKLEEVGCHGVFRLALRHPLTFPNKKVKTETTNENESLPTSHPNTDHETHVELSFEDIVHPYVVRYCENLRDGRGFDS